MHKEHHMTDPALDEDPLIDPPNQVPNVDVRHNPLIENMPDDTRMDKTLLKDKHNYTKK